MTDEPDMVTLYCPPGAESAPISVGLASYQAYRENGETGAWIVRVPRHHMVYLTERGAGFGGRKHDLGEDRLTGTNLAPGLYGGTDHSPSWRATRALLGSARSPPDPVAPTNEDSVARFSVAGAAV
jgi:hypothetical protein